MKHFFVMGVPQVATGTQVPLVSPEAKVDVFKVLESFKNIHIVVLPKGFIKQLLNSVVECPVFLQCKEESNILSKLRGLLVKRATRSAQFRSNLLIIQQYPCNSMTRLTPLCCIYYSNFVYKMGSIFDDFVLKTLRVKWDDRTSKTIYSVFNDLALTIKRRDRT